MFGSLLMDHHIVATSFACAVALSSTGCFEQITDNLAGPVLLLVGGETMKCKCNIFGLSALTQPFRPRIEPVEHGQFASLGEGGPGNRGI
ncbi:hypothetical protein BKA70DRAFT_1324065 [Coprinopsis sp. MPI-PUGE-AT-0042]|nr:hypothetical protein BKA70DRAFT_1324065 [Coprinopsis sp. MPI-PUGE-AT-0042]